MLLKDLEGCAKMAPSSGIVTARCERLGFGDLRGGGPEHIDDCLEGPVAGKVGEGWVPGAGVLSTRRVADRVDISRWAG